jgi:YVTN family beta-propeller protein
VECIACEPDGNRVYCGSEGDPLTVIDAAADTVVASLNFDLHSLVLLFSPVRNRLYSLDGWRNELDVFNDSGDRMIARLPFNKGTPMELCYNPANGLVYCACYDRPDIVVIDGATHARVADIMCADQYPFCMTCAIRENKVYVLGWSDSNITVIDCATNRVIKTMPGGPSPSSLCYNLMDDKLYCASSYDDTIRVYNCADDVLFRAIQAGTPCSHLVYNAIDDRVYGWDPNVYPPEGIAIIDGSTDTVCRVIGLVNPQCLTFDPSDDRLYVSAGPDPACSTTVIDGKRDSVLCRDEPYSLLPMCFDSLDDRMFMSTGLWVCVLDCRTNHCIDSVRLSDSTGCLCYNARGNHVACALGDSVAFIDGKSLHVDTVIPVGTNPSALAWNPVLGRLYVANSGSSSVSVIRDKLAPGIGEGGLSPGASSPKLEAWPSPCRGVLHVRLAGAVASPKLRPLEIYNAAGRSVMSFSLKPGAETALDLRHFAPGVYFVREQSSAVSGQRPAIRKFLLVQ